MARTNGLLSKFLDAVKKSLKESTDKLDELGDVKYTDFGESWKIDIQPIQMMDGEIWDPEELTVNLVYNVIPETEEEDDELQDMLDDKLDRYADIDIIYDEQHHEIKHVYCKDVYKKVREYMLDTYDIDLDKVPTKKRHTKFEVEVDSSKKAYAVITKIPKDEETEVILTKVFANSYVSLNTLYDNINTILDCDEFVDSLDDGDNTVCIVDDENTVSADIVDQEFTPLFQPLVTSVIIFRRYLYAMLHATDKLSNYYNVLVGLKYTTVDLLDIVCDIAEYSCEKIDLLSSLSELPGITDIDLDCHEFNTRICRMLNILKSYMCDIPMEFVGRYQSYLDTFANILLQTES